MMDGNHLTTYVNRAMAEMLGYQQSEMIGKKVEDFFFPEDSSFHKDKMAKRHAGVDEVYDRRFRCRDGSELWTTVSAKALSDEQGRFAGSFAMFTDITERKRTDEALRISEANLQAIMANTTDVIASYDREVRLLVFNKACAEIYRRLFNVELYPGLCMLDLFPEADREFWREKNARALGGESFSFEFELTFSDGCRLVFESTMHPIRQGNEVVGFTTTTRDITERKRSEEALRTSEARYRQAQAIGHVGNWEYNIQTTQFWGSDEAKRIYGFDPAQSNFSADEVEKCIPERERVHQALIDLIEADKPYNLEFEIIPRNSSESRIITSIAELEHDEHGDPFRVVGVIQDITERKQAEEEKEKLQAQLSQSQKMESVGRLAGGVAHDFNNMLQAILGHAELALLKVGPDETLYADLKEIQKAAQRSADLTRQLLAFARKQTVAPRVLDLNETVEGMLKMLRRLIGEDIDLAWLPGSNIGPVFMDPSQMDQILANLCVNARDAIAGTGKITIETDSVSFDEAYCANHAGFIPGEFVMLAVSDNGCGMDAGTLNHLFEPFFTTKDIGKGTGLGLATVYGAVSQNNGFVNVYSEPGHGTTFKIYLPLYAVRATPRPEQERAPAPAAGGETILLVEDEPAILKMTMLMLESMGYAIIAAATPGEAIRLAREHTGRIDLLMTDVVMPEMNGRELAVNLMSIYPDIRRLFMSGYTANVIAHQGVLDQGVHFIQKPFSMQVLSAKIREALNRE
jgi:PAS domain S-box-containing protein